MHAGRRDNNRIELRSDYTRAGDHGRPCRLSRRSAEPYARLRQSRRRVDGQPRINPSRQRTIRRLPRRRISRLGDERKRQCVGWNDRPGLEHALTPAWSISFEYNYYRFASANVSTPQTISATRTVPPAFTVDPSITSGVTADMQVVKLALNYHWGEDLAAAWTYAPAFAIAAMPVTAQPAFLAKGWAFESGARYWY